MSKSYVNELRAQSAEQVTEKLADYCERRIALLSDPGRGRLRTVFGIAVMLATEHPLDLIRVAAEKNGVEMQGHDDTIAAIGRAAQERGSPSAAKIVAHATAIDGFSRIAEERHAGIWEKLNITKESGPR